MAGVHVDGGDERRLHMRHQRNAARPEPWVLPSAGDLLAHCLRERPVDGRYVDPDLLEHPAVHDRHDTAAGILLWCVLLRRIGRDGAAPGRAFEASGGATRRCGVAGFSSEAPRVGIGGVRTWRTRWAP